MTAVGRTRTEHWPMVAAVLALISSVVGGCASQTFERPPDFEFHLLRERSETIVENRVRVSAAVPSREQVNAIFGVDLSSRGIQPLWLEIENGTQRRLNFLRTGLDPEYFSPREVGFLFSGSLTAESKKRLDWHLERLNFNNSIDAGSTVAGFVYTNKDRETKVVSIDLLSPGWSENLTMLVPVPDGMLGDVQVERVYALLARSSIIDVEEESELRTRLEKLPCCTATEQGIQAEPLNVVLVGNIEQVASALLRRGYRYSPVSPLYAFGRPQEWSGEKGHLWVPAQPHVLRLWVAELRFRGKTVWVGHISTPLGGRFARSESETGATITDPDVDEARNDFVQDAIYSQLLSDIGFVKGVGPVSASSPRTTPGGSQYHTDGLRAVLIFASDPVSMTQIEFFNWESLADQYRR